MADRQYMDSIFIENVRLMFKNFAGERGRYNREGDRNYAVALPADIAEDLASRGLNVKYRPPRDEGDEPQAYVQVKVNYRGPRPPRIYTVTSRGKTLLDDSTVGILDWAVIEKADVVLNPYHYEVDGEQGWTLYTKSLAAHIQEDEFDLKYADVADAESTASALESQGITVWED